MKLWIHQGLASYEVPTRFVFRNSDGFPRTLAGKVHEPRLIAELEVPGLNGPT